MSGRWLAPWVLLLSGCVLEPNDLVAKGATLAAACEGCHSAPAGSAIPDLSRLSAQQIAERFEVYRTDPVGPTAMHRLARGYNQQESQAVAEYLGR